MRTALRLTAALLAGLALPALAQTTTPLSPAPGRPTATTVAPRNAPATSNRAASPATSPSATSPSANAPAATPTGSVPSTTATRPGASPAAAPAAANATSAATAARSPVPAAGARIDINSASETELDALPGVGPVRAKSIVAGRPWDDVNDLAKKGAVPQNVLAGMKDRIALANINTSSAADMAKTLPGIGEVRARAIVNGRPYTGPQDLLTKKVLTQGVYDKVKDLVAY